MMLYYSYCEIFFIFIYSIWNLVFGSWFVPGGKGENGDIDNLKSVQYIGVNMSIIVSDDPIYRLFKIIESIFLTLYQFLSSFLLISPVISIFSINIFVAKLYWIYCCRCYFFYNDTSSLLIISPPPTSSRNHPENVLQKKFPSFAHSLQK